MKISFARNVSWRAVYVHSGMALRFSIGIDPIRHPQLFGAIGWRRDCTGGRNAAWHWRIPLPRWQWLSKLDGRKY